MLTLHAAGLLGLIITAIINLRTYCESHGCMGLALLWVIWAAVYALILALGLRAYRRLLAEGGKSALRYYLLATQLALGAGLFGYMVFR